MYKYSIKMFHMLQMDNGYRYGGHRAGLHGYDIGPSKNRIHHGTPVDMVFYEYDYPEGGVEIEIEYEQGYHPSQDFYASFNVPDKLCELRDTVAYAADSRYKSETNRLQTFRDMWQEENSVKPEDLARDGFIYIGPADKVKCVFCLNSLSHWDAGDSVEAEHRKFSPFCPFVRGKCHGVNIPQNARENMKQSYGITMKPAGQTAVPNCKIFLNVYNHLRSDQSKHT